mgnify:CR=1 FL=1
MLTFTDNDGPTVGTTACVLDGDLVIACFDGDGVSSTGLLVGLVEGDGDKCSVGKLVNMELSNDVFEVGAADAA